MTPAGDAPHVHSARQRPACPTRSGGRTPRARYPRSSLVLGALVLAAVVSTRWVRLNVSPSVPYGLYRLAAVPTPLTPGTLVVLPVPDSMRAWQTIPLLKPVAAVAGDTVCVEAERLQIAGVDFGPVYRAAQGHTLPTLDGCATVPVGAARWCDAYQYHLYPPKISPAPKNAVPAINSSDSTLKS